jgi:hypothetical protein
MMTEYENNPQYEKIEENSYIDKATGETVVVLTAEEREASRAWFRAEREKQENGQ